MCDANSTLCLIHVLSSSTTRAVRIDAEVFIAHSDVHFFRLGQNSHRRGRRVYSTLVLCRRNTLNSVHTGFELQLSVHASALDSCRSLFYSPRVSTGHIQELSFPSTYFCVFEVHLQLFCGKERCFLTPSTSTDFQNNALLIIRVTRD